MRIVPPKQMKEYRYQLMGASFTAKKNDHRKRKAMLRLCLKHLPKRPEFAYYLSLGTVPTSLSVFEE